MSDSTIHVRHGDLLWREIEGEAVLLDARSWDYLGLNEAGQVLWARLQDGATRTQLVESLTDQFEISAEVAARDVDGFVEQLRAMGLIQE
jgi:hypothetical protein